MLNSTNNHCLCYQNFLSILWANGLLLDVLKAVTIQGTTIPDGCMKLLSHIANAQTIWANRIQGFAPPVSVWQLHDLLTCEAMLIQSGKELMDVAATDPSSDRVIKYKISTGELFETTITDILLHTFNHSTYHRAQIAKELKANGIQPPNMDYIQYVRR